MKFLVRTEKVPNHGECTSDYLKPVNSFYKMEMLYSQDMDLGFEIVREWYVKVGNLDTLKTFCDMLSEGNNDAVVYVSLKVPEIVICID